MRSPSLNTLKSQLVRYDGKMRFSVDTTARIIRSMILDIPNGCSHNKIDEVLSFCNMFLAGYGIEPIRGLEQVDRYYFDIHLLYVNMGDTYAPTIIYDTLKEQWYCCSWGDIVENDERRFV